MCESLLPISAFSLIAAVMVVATYSVANLVLELDIEATVTQGDDMLEVEGAKDGVEKEGVANGRTTLRMTLHI